jgi:hypothetical protein
VSVRLHCAFSCIAIKQVICCCLVVFVDSNTVPTLVTPTSFIIDHRIAFCVLRVSLVFSRLQSCLHPLVSA